MLMPCYEYFRSYNASLQTILASFWSFLTELSVGKSELYIVIGHWFFWDKKLILTLDHSEGTSNYCGNWLNSQGNTWPPCSPAWSSSSHTLLFQKHTNKTESRPRCATVDSCKWEKTRRKLNKLRTLTFRSAVCEKWNEQRHIINVFQMRAHLVNPTWKFGLQKEQD